jgi:hypothetical protein
VSKGGPVLGIGTNVDLTNTLGVDSSTDAFRLDGLYRFNDRHAIGLAWYRVGLSGNKSLNQQIDINDQTIAAGASTTTSLNFNIWRLLYNYVLPERQGGVGGVAGALHDADKVQFLSARHHHITHHWNI